MNSATEQLHGPSPKAPAYLPWAWLLVAVVIIATFYPGIMSNDSLASLKQARTFVFTDWHPPIMALIWGVLDRVVQGPGLMLIAQAVLYSVAVAVLCAAAFPNLVARYSAWIVVPLFGLFPPAMTLNGMIWKDVWMSGFLLLALAHLFVMLRQVQRRSRMRSAAVVLVACLLATAFRHNALAATAGLLAGACYLVDTHTARPWRRLVVSCVAGVAFATVLSLFISLATRLIASPAHVTTPILLHDIAGMIVESGEPQVAARYALSLAPGLTDNRKQFLKRIKKYYTPAAAIRILRTSRKPKAPFSINVYDADHDAASVKHAWLGMVERYPGPYLRHRAKAFACLMQLCNRSAWVHHSYILNEEYLLPDTLPTNSIQAGLRKLVANPSLAPAYAPIFWLTIVGASALLGLARLRSREGVCLFMALSGFGLAVSLFFTSPIESFRYVHWIVLTGWATIWVGLDAWTQT